METTLLQKITQEIRENIKRLNGEDTTVQNGRILRIEGIDGTYIDATKDTDGLETVRFIPAYLKNEDVAYALSNSLIRQPDSENYWTQITRIGNEPRKLNPEESLAVTMLLTTYLNQES